jgi:serine/arginine repetitive matrix protein 2
LVTAIPSKSGPSSEANASFNNNNISFEGSSWGSIPSSVLAPKPESAPKRRLVPKKSKLGLLNVVNHKDKRPTDLGGTSHHDAGDQSFDIYVDPTIDPDIGEILMVRKKKSRAALDGMRWGPMGEVTNVPASSSVVKNEKPKEAPLQPSAVSKVKGEENNKWWSIGRGRRDSKDKSVKEGKENMQQARAKCMVVS